MKLAIIRLVIVFPLITRAAFGQTAAINGEISGTVLDPSGAPIVNAKVGATNAGTGYQQTTTTTSVGLYRLPVLPLGEYSLTVQANGFALYKQSRINPEPAATSSTRPTDDFSRRERRRRNTTASSATVARSYHRDALSHFL